MSDTTATWTSPLLDLLFDEPSVGRCLVAPDGSVLRANSEWLRSTGFSLDDVLGASIVDLFPETRDMAVAMHTRVRAGHEVEVPLHAQCINGREAWWRGRIEPVPMEGGIGLLITAREVTREMAVPADTVPRPQPELAGPRAGPDDAEAAYQAERLAKLAETVPGVICSYRLRPDGVASMPFATRAVEDLYGFPQEVLARDMGPVFALVHPEDIQRVNDALAEAARTCSRWHDEFRYLHPTKGLRWIEGWSAPVTEPDGSILWHGYVTDATDRKQREEESRRLFVAVTEERDRLTALVDSITDEVWFADIQGHITLVNPSAGREFGLPRGSEPTVEGLASSLEILRPDGTLRPVDEAPLLRSLRGEVLRNEEEVIRTRASGERRHREVSSSPVRSAGGKIVGAVCVVRDVTERKRAEEATRESEARFRALADGTPVPIWITDATGRALFVNRAFCETFGTSQEEITTKGWQPLIHPDDAPAYVGAYMASLSGRTPFRAEARARRADGEWRWFESVGQPRLDANGRLVAMAGSTSDITERKRAEFVVRESEQRFRALADSMPQLAWTAQPDGYITWYNRRWYQYTGTTPEQMEGWGWQSVHDPSTLPHVLRRWKNSIATGTAFEMEFPLRGADSRFRRFLTRVFPVKDLDGNVIQWLGTNTDVTELVEAQELLAVVTRLYVVLSHVNEAIIRTRDEQSLYEAVCRIIAEDGGFPLVWVGLVSGREVRPVASSGGAADYLRSIKVEIEGELGQGPAGTCIREDHPVINDDFDTNPSTLPWREPARRHGLRASASFPIHKGGEVVGALMLYADRPEVFTSDQVQLLEALCADLSYALGAIQHERRRAEVERALRESEQGLRVAASRKDEFLGMLSHELRNPLAPIRNSTYILRHAEPGSGQARRAQSVIERQTEHLTRLVDDLLDVTRIARGKIELRPSRVDLRDVVSHAAEDFRVLMQDRGVRLDVLLPDGSISADADATRVTQVIGNLLHNASKFTRRGDCVTLSVGVEEGWAEIRVRDTGAGIHANLLPTIFEPFVQGERTLARAEGGLGLGLALVKGIAELHGGSVRAESAGKGKGSEFVVRLPVVASTTLSEPPDPIERRPRGRRVLVVDDNQDAAESLADLVRMLGHTVDVAYDGPTAIEKAHATPPDVVLCDIGLPGMTGYEVAKALRTDNRDGMQIFAVSGYARSEDVQRAIDAGFDGHVAKPCDPQKIERLLS
jgi:PAS domain S-box-containing protein